LLFLPIFEKPVKEPPMRRAPNNSAIISILRYLVLLL
jgi:hypothetical protein